VLFPGADRHTGNPLRAGQDAWLPSTDPQEGYPVHTVDKVYVVTSRRPDHDLEQWGMQLSGGEREKARVSLLEALQAREHARIEGYDVREVQFVGQSRDVRDVNSQNWSGNWAHSSVGKIAFLKGGMKLEAKQDGLVHGQYDYGADREVVTGTLDGTLSPDAQYLEGTWRNHWGQEGRFFLRLGVDRKSFDGRYSMSNTLPGEESPNVWRGVREDRDGEETNEYER